MPVSSVKGLILNGFDCERLGLLVQNDMAGWRASLSVQDRKNLIPGRVGTIPLAMDNEVAPRTFVLGCIQKAVSRTFLQQYLEELKGRLYEGTVEVAFGDDATRIWFCHCMGVDVTPIAPGMIQNAHQMRITLEAADPQGYDVQTSVVDFTKSKASLPLGTGVSLPLVRIHGAVTNPVITYRDARGVVVSTLSLTATIASGSYYEIDCERMTIVDGAGANQVATLSGGDFLRLDPHDGMGESGPFPTLEISPAPAAATAEFRRAWL